MPSSAPQLALFTAEQLPEPSVTELPFFEYDAALAVRLPSHVLFGTSSWSFAGWSGIVYPGQLKENVLAERGLEIYAQHPLFRTVGIDRSYYSPVPDTDWRRYSEQLPDGFLCVAKTWNAITSRVDPRTLVRNPRYMDVGLFEDVVLGPMARSFSGHMGPIVIEFAPIPTSVLPDSSQFVEELDAFLEQLPSDFPYVVEIRNRELLTQSYLRTLRRHGVGHVLNLWERMPNLADQMVLPNVLTSEYVVCRLMIKPGKRYEVREKEFAPYNKLVEPDEDTRVSIQKLADITGKTGRTLIVIVNNKFEGCSPLSIRAMAEKIVSPNQSSF